MAEINGPLIVVETNGSEHTLYPNTRAGNILGVLSISQGGTGASTPDGIRNNIGAAAADHTHPKTEDVNAFTDVQVENGKLVFRNVLGAVLARVNCSDMGLGEADPYILRDDQGNIVYDGHGKPVNWLDAFNGEII